MPILPVCHTSFVRLGWILSPERMQELNRVLCEKLDEKMKGTSVEGTIQKLFEGECISYIECNNVNFKSTRTEAFQDLQLDVQGCKDVYKSFEKYVAVEQLEGANQYDAKEQGHGMQDARKGVWFRRFPPVLELQLKRFDYDFARDQMVKINSRYEFPPELDLDKYLAPDAERGVRNLYALHSVLVHSGGVHGGHYYAYIRPTLEPDGGWFKFDDERVSKEEPSAAIDQQFGGQDETPPAPGYGTYNPQQFKYTRHSNAYMLVYVRLCDKDHIVCPVSEDEIAAHLRQRLRREAEEKARKKQERAEAHLYIVVKVATDADLEQQIGGEIHFDLVNHEKVRHFRVLKATPFAEVKSQVETALGVPLARQSFWTWAKRQNNTFRPRGKLLPAEEAMTVSQLQTAQAKDLRGGNDTDLRLFLTQTPEPGPSNLREAASGVAEILLFFKLYSPESNSLRYVGHGMFNATTQMGAMREFCNQRAGFPLDTELAYYEEVKSEPEVMCEELDKKQTPKAAQLEDGDIICFQRAHLPNGITPRFTNVKDFMGYVKNRQVVNFRELEKPKDQVWGAWCHAGVTQRLCTPQAHPCEARRVQGTRLELLKHNTYEEVTAALAKHLGLQEPSWLRLTQHNVYTHQPKPSPIRYQGIDRLSEMTQQYAQVC